MAVSSSDMRKAVASLFRLQAAELDAPSFIRGRNSPILNNSQAKGRQRSKKEMIAVIRHPYVRKILHRLKLAARRDQSDEPSVGQTKRRFANKISKTPMQTTASSSKALEFQPNAYSNTVGAKDMCNTSSSCNFQGESTHNDTPCNEGVGASCDRAINNISERQQRRKTLRRKKLSSKNEFKPSIRQMHVPASKTQEFLSKISRGAYNETGLSPVSSAKDFNCNLINYDSQGYVPQGTIGERVKGGYQRKKQKKTTGPLGLGHAPRYEKDYIISECSGNHLTQRYILGSRTDDTVDGDHAVCCAYRPESIPMVDCNATEQRKRQRLTNKRIDSKQCEHAKEITKRTKALIPMKSERSHPDDVANIASNETNSEGANCKFIDAEPQMTPTNRCTLPHSTKCDVINSVTVKSGPTKTPMPMPRKSILSATTDHEVTTKMRMEPYAYGDNLLSSNMRRNVVKNKNRECCSPLLSCNELTSNNCSPCKSDNSVSQSSQDTSSSLDSWYTRNPRNIFTTMSTAAPKLAAIEPSMTVPVPKPRIASIRLRSSRLAKSIVDKTHKEGTVQMLSSVHRNSHFNSEHADNIGVRPIEYSAERRLVSEIEISSYDDDNANVCTLEKPTQKKISQNINQQTVNTITTLCRKPHLSTEASSVIPYQCHRINDSSIRKHYSSPSKRTVVEDSKNTHIRRPPSPQLTQSSYALSRHGLSKRLLPKQPHLNVPKGTGLQRKCVTLNRSDALASAGSNETHYNIYRDDSMPQLQPRSAPQFPSPHNSTDRSVTARTDSPLQIDTSQVKLICNKIRSGLYETTVNIRLPLGAKVLRTLKS